MKETYMKPLMYEWDKDFEVMVAIFVSNCDDKHSRFFESLIKIGFSNRQSQKKLYDRFSFIFSTKDTQTAGDYMKKENIWCYWGLYHIWPLSWGL